MGVESHDEARLYGGYSVQAAKLEVVLLPRRGVRQDCAAENEEIHVRARL